VAKLARTLADPAVRFLTVVGMSGSGKSSLVMAGLIPRLRQGVVDGTPWRDLIFTPTRPGGDPFGSLAEALKQALGTTGEPARGLVARLRDEPGVLGGKAAELLADTSPGAELVLVVDQLEELFTRIEEADRDAFLGLLSAARAVPRLRVVTTLRADFYVKAVNHPALSALLRRDRGTFPLDPPGQWALHEMVAGPAGVAGLELEEGLVDAILKDTGTAPGALAFMAFALHELYRRGKAAGRLTLADYRAIGRVSGAMSGRAEAVLTRAAKGRDPDRVLDPVFQHLVEVDEREVATRRRAYLDEVRALGGGLVDVLVEARLLTTGRDAAERPTVEVAHEALLTGWQRLVRWIERRADDLRARRDLERVAEEWHGQGEPGSGLRFGAVLKRYRRAPGPGPLARAYLEACGRRQALHKAAIGIASLLVVLAGGVLWRVNESQYPPGQAAWCLLISLGIVAPPEPAMVGIPAGRFPMGSADGDSDERPIHEVVLDRDFEMGRYEVTFEEYDAFAAATGRAKPDDEGWRRGRRPVINVSREDAVAYTRWLSAKTGKAYRLPSEAEWEYAARAGTTTAWFWGDDKEGLCDFANGQDQTLDGAETTWESTLKTFRLWDPAPCEDGFVYTAPVGSLAANDFGLYDTAGNVWEWTTDCWHDDYKGAPEDGSAWEPGCGRALVVRGGAWDDRPGGLRSASRFGDGPAYRGGDLGFRLARSL
jgi:formylglycine-generating enzyme required for sulfatase activity